MAIIHYAAKSYQFSILESSFNRQDIDINAETSNDILLFYYFIMKLQWKLQINVTIKYF